MKKFNLEIPFFPGFYDSWAYSSDSEYYAIKDEIDYYNGEYADMKHIQHDLFDEDDFQMDFERFKDEFATAYLDKFFDYCRGFVISANNHTIVSPKYYNFETDKLYADVELEDNWLDEMKKFINENLGWFKQRIHKDWTSYDGFISFMDNTVEDWIMHLEENDERYIGCMLGYMAFCDYPNIKKELQYDMEDFAFLGEYIELSENGKEKLQDALDNRPKGWYMTGQVEINFEDSKDSNEA